MLRQTFLDLGSGTPAIAGQARAWLLGDSDTLRLWAALAGVSLDHVRRAVHRAGAHTPATLRAPRVHPRPVRRAGRGEAA